MNDPAFNYWDETTWTTAQRQAYREGSTEAQKRPEEQRDCPYPAPSSERNAWEAGYSDRTESTISWRSS